MPDIQIRVQVVGSDQSIAKLNNVGAAAKSAGKAAAAGGGGILSFAGKAAGAATGALAFSNGLFGITDAFDAVKDADLAVAKAHTRTERSAIALQKAQEKVKDEFKDTTKTIRDNNGAVGIQTEHILSYNEATDEAIVQTRTSNGEMKISTKNIKANSTAYQDLEVKQEKYNNDLETEKKAKREDDQIHQRFLVTLGAETLQMGLGILAMAPFIKTLIDMASGGKGAASAVKSVGDAAGGAGSTICAQVDCTEKAAGAVGQLGAQAVRSAIPIRAFTAGVAIVGGGAGLMATNLFGARDAMGGLANAVQNAVPMLKPLGLSIESLTREAKILPDPFNTANQEIGTATGGISTEIMRMGQVGGEGISFLTRGFQQFSTQIAAGNIGGAVDTAIGGITRALDRIKNISFSSNATINWVIKNIWPALQTIYADLKTAWGAVSISYNATVNWLTTHVWPALVDAYAKLRQTWGNVVIAYNATVNWLVAHVWPTLANAYAKLRETWSNVTIAYNATVNWLVVHAWPTIQDAYAKLRQTWGNVVAAYNATINWLVVHVWPTIQDAFAKLRQTWGNVVIAYNATVNWLVIHVWPTIQDAYAKLRQVWGNVVTAYNATVNWIVVQNWPLLSDAAARLRQVWGNVILAYNATVNWLVTQNWPQLSDASAKLRQVWGNVIFAYNATVNWLVSYKWPSIGDILGDVRKSWGAISFAYNAAVNMITNFRWPTYSEILAALISALGVVSLPFAATINLSGSKFDFPDIGKALTTWAASVKIPNLDSLWGSIKAAIKAPAPTVAAAIWSALGLAARGGTFIVPPEAEQKILAFVKQYQAQQAAPKAPTVGQLGGGTPTTTGGGAAGPGRAPFPIALTGASGPYMQPATPYRTPTGAWAWHYITQGGVVYPAVARNFVQAQTPISSGGGTAAVTPVSTTQGIPGTKGALAPTLSGLSSSTGYVTTQNPITRKPVLVSQIGQAGFKKAARGGSFIVDRPMSFGKDLSVGEGFNPELITLVPLANSGGAAILDVMPLKGAFAPHSSRKDTGLRKTWLGGSSVPIGSYSYGSGSLSTTHTVAAAAATGGSFVISKPTTFGNVAVGEGYKPELLTFIPFGGAVGGGILNVIPLTRKPRDNSSGRHFAAGGNAIIGDLSAGIAKSVINLGVQVDSKDAENKVGSLKSKLDESLPETRKTTLTAEATGFEGSINRITSQLNTIPKESRSTATMDANAAISAVNQFKSALNAIPATKTVTLTTISTPITHAQHGFGPGIVSKPTLFMAGENGPEFVSVRPMGASLGAGRGRGLNRAISNLTENNNIDNNALQTLIGLLRKFVSIQALGKGALEANLFVDGQRMASVAQRYMGSKSYGDR